MSIFYNGSYVNPGSQLWRNAINSEIYVDKTMLISHTNAVINTNRRFMCVSRPRRFGKTMALHMLSAYYCKSSGSRDEFKNTKIYTHDSFDKHANKYNVIFVDMVKIISEAAGDVEQMISYLRKIILYELQRQYPDVDYFNRDNFIESFKNVFQQTGDQFVILIDEWDGIFREYRYNIEAQRRYLDFLRNWLKDQDYIALAYMTGILPIKKYGGQSALNMFSEYSMEDPIDLEEFVGFTDKEVKILCYQYGMDYNQCKTWYDGYAFTNITEIYNPLSVVEAMIRRRCGNYWNKTEYYEALKSYIELNYEGLKDTIIELMAGVHVCIDTSTFANDMVTFDNKDDILTLLIHLGYLGYDSNSKEVFIPNNEIRSEFATSIRNSKVLTDVARSIRSSDELLEATLSGDEKKVAKLVELAHLETSTQQYNDENALSYTISLAYYTARSKYKIYREMPAGKGFADMIFLPLPHHPEMPPIIVELKWNRSANTAIKQIKNKEYTEALKPYEGRIILVGINYSKATKRHTCKIEKA